MTLIIDHVSDYVRRDSGIKGPGVLRAHPREVRDSPRAKPAPCSIWYRTQREPDVPGRLPKALALQPAGRLRERSKTQFGSDDRLQAFDKALAVLIGIATWKSVSLGHVSADAGTDPSLSRIP